MNNRIVLGTPEKGTGATIDIFPKYISYEHQVGFIVICTAKFRQETDFTEEKQEEIASVLKKMYSLNSQYPECKPCNPSKKK
jgi:hypothetical protein